MPKEKDFKRRVRERMQKTGEAYTAARARLIEKRETLPRLLPAAELAELAGMSDDAVRAKTGKGWSGWVRALDALDATELSHSAIAQRLHDDFAVPGWWAQMVTVGYERIRGLRAKGQRRGGGYEVNKSLTVPVPLARLWRAFGARERKRWLPAALTVRKSTPEKSIRARWDDDTPVVVYFLAKGPAKSQVTIQHGNLPSKARADELRAVWTERFAALKALLAGAQG